MASYYNEHKKCVNVITIPSTGLVTFKKLPFHTFLAAPIQL